MSRGNYSMGKRQRDNEKARKKRRKDERRQQKREAGTSAVPISTPEDVVGDLIAAERDVKAKRAAAEAGARTIPSRLFVGGLSWDTNAEDLRAAFERIGQVADAVALRGIVVQVALFVRVGFQVEQYHRVHQRFFWNGGIRSARDIGNIDARVVAGIIYRSLDRGIVVRHIPISRTTKRTYQKKYATNRYSCKFNELTPL